MGALVRVVCIVGCLMREFLVGTSTR